MNFIYQTPYLDWKDTVHYVCEELWILVHSRIRLIGTVNFRSILYKTVCLNN